MSDTLLFIKEDSVDAIADKIRQILGGQQKYTIPNGIVAGIENCEKRGKDVALQKNFTSYNYKNDSYDEGVSTTGGVYYSFGPYAFAGNTRLTSATIGNTQAIIPSHCFEGCTNLASVNVKKYDNDSGVVVCGADRAQFKECTSLTSIYLAKDPRDFKSAIYPITLCAEAFSGCTSLTSCGYRGSGSSVFYAGVGDECFLDCSSLTSFTFPDYLKTIGESAFRRSGLVSVTIPYCNDPITIGTYAFAECEDLVSISLPSLGLSAIPDGCFQGCTSLESITIPRTVTSIGNDAFAGCTSLRSVTFQGLNGSATPSITSIGARAFDGCSALENITIPATVTNMGAYSFRNCSSMEYIRMLPTTPPTAGAYMFNNTINNPLTIYVPDATSLAAYQSATNWKTSSYKSHMAIWSEGEVGE